MTVTLEDRIRLRDKNLAGLCDRLAEVNAAIQRDLADTEPGVGTLAFRGRLLRHSRLELQAIAREMRHREECNACLQDKPCPDDVR